MIGKTISHYKIIEKLGEGGMGVVYKAEDTKLKRTVALKFLSPQAVGGQEDKKRFVREAQAAAALHHPNICTVFEIDEAEGQTFIAMAYLDGESVKHRIEAKPLKLDEAVDIAMQVADGLHEAHENGIVHRDIKSSNIMVTTKNQAILMDFGLAKQAGKTMITKEGTSMGTVAYMSPEQAQGATVDHRTDIWSFGVMLYEMVTGQLPFKGDYEQAVVYSIMNEDAEPMTGLRTGVPMELERIVNKAMAKNPDDRYQNVNDMLIDLRLVAKELESGTTRARVTTAARPEKAEGISLFKDLLQRRVPQILGIYFAASWAVIQFVDWLVSRYPISPHLPDFSLVALTSMIPTILLMGYFHGRPGCDRWTRIEKIGIPINLLTAVALLFFIFQGKDLGATTKTASYMDEQGNEIERIIPKSEFRKSVAIFPFENDSGDTTLNWLQYGLVELVGFDLTQDIYIRRDWDFLSNLIKAGFANGVGAPLPVLRNIAKKYHYNHFVSGSISTKNDSLFVKTSLYKSGNSKLIKENTFCSTDIFELADLISVQLKNDLEVPIYHIDKTEDLPVADMTTNSIIAFENYIASSYAIQKKDDYNTASKKLEQAIEEDPYFALALFDLCKVYLNLNQRDKAENAIRTAMQHRVRLPESYQFLVKMWYFEIQGKWHVAFETAKNWVQLYPEEIDGHETLAMYYSFKMQKDEAIAERKIMLELDPDRHQELHEIGELYMDKGEYGEALKYYKQYAEKFPNDYSSFTTIGRSYITIGEYEQAKLYYKKAFLIEPENIQILIALANIEIGLGEFEEALQQYQNALKMAETSRDLKDVYTDLSNYYKFRGQVGKAIEFNNLKFTEMAKFASPFEILFEKVDSELGFYIETGKEDMALQNIMNFESQASQLPPPFNNLQFLPRLSFYVMIGNSENLEETEKLFKKMESFVNENNWEPMKVGIFLVQGKIHEFKKEYSQAIESYRTAVDMGKPDWQGYVSTNVDIGKCYRQLQEFKIAEEYMQQALKLEPYEPTAHYEIALVYWEMDKKEKAFEHLKTALQVWDEADAEYKPAKEAREKLAEWELGTKSD